MDVTTSSPADITCVHCGASVPFSESVYVDGGGQMCRSCYPLPQWLEDIEPPW
jgi:hypothetical protein